MNLLPVLLSLTPLAPTLPKKKPLDAVDVLYEASFTPKELCRITQGVVKNLKVFKDNRFVHANIKPENIHLHKTPLDVHYTFLKIAQTEHSRLFTQKYPEGGTIGYKPPEHFDPDKRVSYVDKIDPWAAGVTLYFLCANDKERFTFATLAARRALGDKQLYPWIEKQRSILSEHTERSSMAKLLFHLLDPNPETRWSADEAIQESAKLKITDFMPFYSDVKQNAAMVSCLATTIVTKQNPFYDNFSIELRSTNQLSHLP